MSRNIPKDDALLLDEFLARWAVPGVYGDEEKLTIINAFNSLVVLKARPFPHYGDFLRLLHSFKQVPVGDEKFTEWMGAFYFLADQDRAPLRNLASFIQFSTGLLDSMYLFKSSSTIWRIDRPDYTLSLDTTLLFHFPVATLSCYSRRDSISIQRVSGSFDPLNNIWYGKGGLVTWQRAGLPSDSVYANLPSAYTIMLTRPEYTLEEVEFTNRYFFTQPLKGRLEDKVRLVRTPDDANYPRFDSYQLDFRIKNLYPDIHYEGGLSMQGARMVGTGTTSENARLSVVRNDTLLLSAYSGYFAFKSDRINSANAAVVIHLKQDSIFHPGIEFRYVVTTRDLTLNQTDRLTSKSPYYNSYHNVDMTVEQLSWRTNEPVMKLRAPVGAAIANANFESVNFFDYRKFEAMQGMDEIHPLVAVRNFARVMHSEEFTALDFATYIRMPIHLVNQMLMRLSVGGYLFFDANTGSVHLKPKIHLTLAASIAKIDYDVISFPSRTDAPLENALFDLNTYDLTINGIPEIYVSNVQNVLILPRNERIVMKQNRSFHFDGNVMAGLMEFEGQNFFFDYDSFKLNLQNVNIQSIRYLTGGKDNFGFPVTEEVTSKIENITGELQIDAPDNKSGRERRPEYPKFQSKVNSFVFYQRPSIHSNAYPISDFYFQLEPYKLDSMNIITRESIRYKGQLKSAGILPPIEQVLTVQDDRSLGFKHTTTDEGLPLYGGKGIFTNDLQLSNQGLQGKGTVSFLTSVTVSDEIMFYPDSVNIEATDFTIDKQVDGQQFPGVFSKNNYIHWRPYEDILVASMKKTPFTMYNDSTMLYGSLELKPDGLTGEGKMDLRNSDLTSKMFTYQAEEIHAGVADFFLKSLHSPGYTVMTDNLKAHIDYTTGKGYFSSNHDYSLVSFPENRYVSYLDNFEWDMQKKQLAMGSSQLAQEADTTTHSEPVGSTYISIHPSQDSLNFISPLAYYDYSKNILNAKSVQYIDVADARIFPDNREVSVKPDGRLETLENASMIANRAMRYHTIHTASLTILNRKQVEGFGNYDYIDENEEVQLIHFNKIETDESFQTRATGVIFDPDNFRLSPNYTYQGKVALFASEKHLTFDGAVRIDYGCETMAAQWLGFNAPIDPNSIYIPVTDKPRDINFKDLYSGLFLQFDSVHLYPTFFTFRKRYSDVSLVPVSGHLYYDKATQLYRVTHMAKHLDREMPGNYLSLHRESCDMFAEGKVDLGLNFGLVKYSAAGNYLHRINEPKTEFDLVMGLNFFMDNSVLSVLAHAMDSLPNLPAVDLSRSVYTRAMVEFIGKDRTKAFNDELNLFGKVRNVPEELRHTIMFNHLMLEWDEVNRSYVSVGKIGIASINNIQINKLFDGLIEIQVRRSGDLFDIYLEADANNWYYFGYTRGVMQVLSSNNLFIDPIMTMKPNERRQKVSGRGFGDSYIYMVSTDRKKTQFYRRYIDLLEERRNR